MPNEPRRIWSSIREPLQQLTFADMKAAAAAAGLPVIQLSDVRQSYRGGSSKSQLMDAIDGLFRDLDPQQQDQAAIYMVTELVNRLDDRQVSRIEELMERIGWQLAGKQPVPLNLQLGVPTSELPGQVQDAVAKVIRRNRMGDFDGAMTAVVGIIDTTTERIYDENGLQGHRTDSYQKRVTTAYQAGGSGIDRLLDDLPPADKIRVCDAQRRSLNAAAELLGVFRSNYSDVHGIAKADPVLVQTALNYALFVVYTLIGNTTSTQDPIDQDWI